MHIFAQSRAVTAHFLGTKHPVPPHYCGPPGNQVYAPENTAERARAACLEGRGYTVK